MRSRQEARDRSGGRFRYLWATFVVASLGDGFGYGAVPLLALFVDPHPIAVSGVAAADTFPWLVLALPAGALADRYERGRVMALTNMGRAVVLVALAILVATQRIDYLALVHLGVRPTAGRGRSTTRPPRRPCPNWSKPMTFPRANGILSGTEAATEHLGGPILGDTGLRSYKGAPLCRRRGRRSGSPALSLLRLSYRTPQSQGRRTGRSSTA